MSGKPIPLAELVAAGEVRQDTLDALTALGQPFYTPFEFIEGEGSCWIRLPDGYRPRGHGVAKPQEAAERLLAKVKGGAL